MSIIADIGNFLSEKTIFNLPNWIVMVVLGLIALKVIASLKPKNKEYQRINLAKEVRKDLENKSKVFSNISRAGVKDKDIVRYGFSKIGYISRTALVYWKFEKDLKTGKVKLNFMATKKPTQVITEIIEDGKIKKLKPKKESKTEDILKPFYLIAFHEYNTKGRISRAIKFRPKYMLVDINLVRLEADNIVIKENAQFNIYLDVFIFSELGKEVITDVAFKKNLELTLEEAVNYVPKQSFLETSVSHSVAKSKSEADIEKEKYKDHVQT
jgi:hypothetical protein